MFLPWLQVAVPYHQQCDAPKWTQQLGTVQGIAEGPSDSRACRAAAELRNARAALCRALMKVQALEQEDNNADQSLKRLLPPGLGMALLTVLSSC